MPQPTNANPEIQNPSSQYSRDDSRNRDDYNTAIEVAHSTNEKRSNAALMRAAAHAIDAHPEQGYEEFKSDYERLQDKHLLQLTSDFNAGNVTTEEFKNLIRALYSGDSSDLDQLPFYDLRVAKLVLQNHPSPSSNRNKARELSSFSYGLDRDTDTYEAKLRQSLMGSQDQDATDLGSKANSSERLTDIDVTYFVSAMDKLIGDESLPNRVCRTTQPRIGETLTEVYIKGSGVTMELSKTTEPAGEREIDTSRIVSLYHMITEIDGTRVEIHVNDGVLASAAYVDYKNQANTDRATSRKSYDRAMSVFDLAINELDTQSSET